MTVVNKSSVCVESLTLILQGLPHPTANPSLMILLLLRVYDEGKQIPQNTSNTIEHQLLTVLLVLEIKLKITEGTIIPRLKVNKRRVYKVKFEIGDHSV